MVSPRFQLLLAAINTTAPHGIETMRSALVQMTTSVPQYTVDVEENEALTVEYLFFLKRFLLDKYLVKVRFTVDEEKGFFELDFYDDDVDQRVKDVIAIAASDWAEAISKRTGVPFTLR